ncbi:hypothetical protein GE061_011264 [Apolygus lucorum]|uniref:Uncharacterized protein n=1 Tax=Apolygus lucorum TaxID=248454 RepID=A0A8S9XY50_APOLU|nr:hypothetical protein GE061_011264 [Apolygus lucorum]
MSNHQHGKELPLCRNIFAAPFLIDTPSPPPPVIYCFHFSKIFILCVFFSIFDVFNKIISTRFYSSRGRQSLHVGARIPSHEIRVIHQRWEVSIIA